MQKRVAVSGRFVATVALILLGLSVASLQAETQLSEMIVFGDSLSDTGNVLVWSAGVIAAPPYFEGRASNGPVAVEQAALRLGLPQPVASLLGGTNYAYFGAQTLGVSFTPTPDLGDQVSMFFADGNSLDGDELIVVHAGGNDAFAFVFTEGALGNDPATAVQNIVDHVTLLAVAGGKIFVVPNLITIAGAPFIQLNVPFLAPQFEDWVNEFNTLLSEELEQLEAALAITILQLDESTLFDNILTTPERFGFANATEPACSGCNTGTPSPDADDTVVDQPQRYVYWDFVHPSARAHKIIGIAFATFVKKELGIDEDEQN